MNGVSAEPEAAASGTVEVGRRTAWPRAAAAERGVQAAGLVVLGALVGLGLALEPSPTGEGTHCQLGLPPCGMLEATGHPCPTCGVTTAFALAAHGRFADALVTQPFGFVCFLLAAGGALALGAALVTGRSLAPLVTVYGVTVPAALLVLLALVSWAYKWWTT